VGVGCGGPQRARPAGSGVGGGGSSSRASFSHSVLLPFYSTPSIPSLVQPSACNTHTPMAPKYVQAWERSGRRGAGSLAQGDSVPPPGQRSACVLAGALPSRPLCAARFLPPAHLVCDEGEKGGIGVGGRPQAHAGRATGRAARRGGARREKRWAGRRLPSKCAPTRAPTSWPRRRSLAEALDLHPDLDRLEGGGDRESLTRAS